MRQCKRVRRDNVDTVEEQPMLVPSAPPFEIHEDAMEMSPQPTVKNRVAVYEELSLLTSTPIKPLARKRVKVNVCEEGDSILASSPDLSWSSPSSSASPPPTEAAVPPPTPRGPALPPRPAWLVSPVSKDFYTKINLKSNVLFKSFL
jgi:hypothetical protein